MAAALVSIALADRIAVLTMERPPVNAMSRAFMGNLETGLAHAAADPAVRAIIITSALPGMFSGGAATRELGGRPRPPRGGPPPLRGGPLTRGGGDPKADSRGHQRRLPRRRPGALHGVRSSNRGRVRPLRPARGEPGRRSEEHTSELQSRLH